MSTTRAETSQEYTARRDAALRVGAHRYADVLAALHRDGVPGTFILSISGGNAGLEVFLDDDFRLVNYTDLKDRACSSGPHWP